MSRLCTLLEKKIKQLASSIIEENGMDKEKQVLNELLVRYFNDILQIEEKVLKQGPFSDLYVTETHIIDAIGLHKKRTMTEVANDLKITVGTLTTAINKLIKKGYVERTRIEQDRRLVLIGLTDKGKKAYKAHEAFHQEMINTMLNQFTKEEEKVIVSAVKKLSTFFYEKYYL